MGSSWPSGSIGYFSHTIHLRVEHCVGLKSGPYGTYKIMPKLNGKLRVTVTKDLRW